MVDEDSSLSWIWTQVKGLEVQDFSKSEDLGGLLMKPVVCVEK